ncbi:unnamed protein product [Clonostachys byssicola]|uniref:Uncharacterized protein n=1 Tax=Clonostachys byssicola TaxID=160290 RepID=A0A9N9Y4E5_9HYPO|nr:unnamed protein product [Clonostachys byssicola]
MAPADKAVSNMTLDMEASKWTKYQIRSASAANRERVPQQKETSTSVSSLASRNNSFGGNPQPASEPPARSRYGSGVGVGAANQSSSTKENGHTLPEVVNGEKASLAAKKQEEYPTIFLYSYVQSHAPYHVQRWIPPAQIFDMTFDELKAVLPLKLIEGHILTFTLFSEPTGMMYRVGTGTDSGYDWVKERFRQVVKNFIEARGTRDLPNLFYIRVE